MRLHPKLTYVTCVAMTIYGLVWLIESLVLRLVTPQTEVLVGLSILRALGAVSLLKPPALLVSIVGAAVWIALLLVLVQAPGVNQYEVSQGLGDVWSNVYVVVVEPAIGLTLVFIPWLASRRVSDVAQFGEAH